MLPCRLEQSIAPGKQEKITNTKGPQLTSNPRIVLVDQYAILREGLAALLASAGRHEVVGQADSVSAAQRVIETCRPDLVITEIQLNDESALTLFSWLELAYPETKILVLSAHYSRAHVRSALDAGAHGYMLKDAGKSELLTGIRTVLTGKRYVSSDVASRVLTGMFGRRITANSSEPRPVLTNRERQILRMIALANTTKSIAAQLSVSVKTVEKHRANLMKKLRLKNSAAVTLYAVRNGLIPLESEMQPSRLSN